MNKKLLIVLGVLIVLALLFYIVKGRPNSKGFDLSDRHFKIENTEDIQTLSLERKHYPPVIFTKKGDKWFLNNGREARPQATSYLFNVMSKLKIKYIPGAAASEKLRTSIDTMGILVKAFDKKSDLMKAYYIGPDVGDGRATAFMMQGATQPYVMFATGYDGSIRTRFVFDMNEYETKNVFVEDPQNIKEVEIKYPFDKPSSFSIKKTLLGYEIINPYTNTKLPNLNEQLIEPYFSKFTDIIAEYNDGGNSNKEMIIKEPVFCEINLVRKDGSIRNAKVFSLPNIEFKQSIYSPKEVTPDTRFEVLTNKDEFFLIQHRVLGKILLAFDSFTKR